ncbi:hypothetical protein GGQ64_002570 [Rhizobium azooxidifex]|uniref:Uncharacterized protein n=1 Tax=Mycoplana azooxidifex TaxID=1636188 RepID=A0A7W6D7H8_9HYPH|nr:hypothetical protein [Mycoplana azooxidifex]MBB3977364.1 hypothetical protein [Mycoplana azooxidifex]
MEKTFTGAPAEAIHFLADQVSGLSSRIRQLEYERIADQIIAKILLSALKAGDSAASEAAIYLLQSSRDDYASMLIKTDFGETGISAVELDRMRWSFQVTIDRIDYLLNSSKSPNAPALTIIDGGKK